MDKKVKTLDILSEVSANFKGAEDFIKESLEEICFWEKKTVEEVIYFFLFIEKLYENMAWKLVPGAF